MHLRTSTRIQELFGLRLIASLVALLVFVWLARQVAKGVAIGFDAGVRAFVHQNASSGLTGVMRFLSDLGEPGLLFMLGIGALIAMLVLRWNRQAILFLILLSGAFVLDSTLKFTFHRTRPAPFFGTPEPHSSSFPSGHALFSICFFGVLAVIATEHVASRKARAAIWALATVLVSAIGLSRIYLGVHYPSDVVAGYAAAVFWVGAVTHMDRLLRRRSAG